LVRLPLFHRSGNLARFALALLLAGSACNAVRRGGTPDDESDIVTVTIVNHHSLNVTVFNVVQGRRDRLGEVIAAASMSFKLHLRRLPASELQLLADPIGSTRSVTSELLHVAAGDFVQWVLESDLARSHIDIR
jgi:hypothetical protein